MFKKLRNNFLAMNCVIIAALLICCFGVNYLLVYQGMRISTDRKLENEIEMMERRMNGFEGRPHGGLGRRFNGERPPGEDIPREENNPPEKSLDFGRNQAFSPTFSIITDDDGNIGEVNMAFAMTEDFYSGKATEIIASGKDHGRMRGTNSDGAVSNWRYQYKKIDSGYIIAFTEVSTNLATLRMLAVCLLLIALAAAIVTFFISLFCANRSIRPIEAAYNKQKQFIADASHELKTPLATINTNIDVLLSHDAADDEDKKWLLYIKDEARRMSKLTNDLLYLARADYGSENKVYSSVSFTDIVKNALLVMEARVFEQNVTLRSEIADGINIAASAEQLKQLVMILLDNAVKYTPAGGEIELKLSKQENSWGVEPHSFSALLRKSNQQENSWGVEPHSFSALLRKSTQEENSWGVEPHSFSALLRKSTQKTSNACLTVRNTGAGISEADLPHIFDRFYRSDKARTYTENSGYGLGLAIAKAIAESFRGTINAESKPDSYTLFTVKIPLLKE